MRHSYGVGSRARCAGVLVTGNVYIGLPLALPEASNLRMAAWPDLEDAPDATEIELDPVSPAVRINVGDGLETCLGPMVRSDWQSYHAVLCGDLEFPAPAMCQLTSFPTALGFLPAKVEAPQRDWLHRYDAADHPAQLSRSRGGRLAGSG